MVKPSTHDHRTHRDEAIAFVLLEREAVQDALDDMRHQREQIAAEREVAK